MGMDMGLLRKLMVMDMGLLRKLMVMGMLMEKTRNLNQLFKLWKISIKISLTSTQNKTKMISVNLKKMNTMTKRRARKVSKKSSTKLKS